jgi:polysaccharide export outer membrane protein
MKSNFTEMSEKFPLKALLIVPLLALLLSGCDTTPAGDVLAGPDGTEGISAVGARLHAGDSVTITFDGLPAEGQMPPVEKTINEDGTISLADIGSVKAAGLTTGELENVITTNYVPRLLNHLTVTVKAGTRVYYVDGEVAQKNRLEYVGPITVTGAITSAGGFTDFANRKNVVLTRANGKRFKLDCVRILNGEDPDPPVFPGDRIEVKRRMF